MSCRRAEIDREVLNAVVLWAAWTQTTQSGHKFYPDDDGVPLEKEPKPSSVTLTRFVRAMESKFPQVLRDFDVGSYTTMIKTKNQPFNVTERCRRLVLPVAIEYMSRHTEAQAVQVLRRRAVALQPVSAVVFIHTTHTQYTYTITPIHTYSPHTSSILNTHICICMYVTQCL